MCDRRKGVNRVLILIEDKAQQAGKHDMKNSFWKANEIEVVRCPLPVGDYILVNDKVQDVLDRKAKRGIEVKKMDFIGTYDVCVDTKKDIEELLNDIIGKQHARFRDECIFAQNNGIRLYILVENAGCEIYHTGIYNKTIMSLEELHSWKNPRLFIMENSSEMVGTYKNGRPMYRKVQKYPKATRGEQLMKACMTMEQKYGVKFLFCRPSEAGLKVLELLGVNADG